MLVRVDGMIGALRMAAAYVALFAVGLVTDHQRKYSHYSSGWHVVGCSCGGHVRVQRVLDRHERRTALMDATCPMGRIWKWGRGYEGAGEGNLPPMRAL